VPSSKIRTSAVTGLVGLVAIGGGIGCDKIVSHHRAREKPTEKLVTVAFRTPLLTKASLTPLLVYFGQVQQAEEAKEAAERSAILTAESARKAATTIATPGVTGGSDATSVDTADWACIRNKESGDRYNDPTAPSGAYGILHSTADAYGLAWPVSSDSAASQDAVALTLYNKYGWQPWSSRYACGL
jgi:type II secretory pathway pseudopilin PulG